MEDQLWDLFRETGDPMGYLLYRAEKENGNKAKQEASASSEETPPSSA